jgi:predicted kinase
MKYLVASSATDRLGWVLDRLNGSAGWGADAAEVLAPEFSAIVPPGRFVEFVRQRAATFAPLAVTGFDVNGLTVRARVRVRDDSVQVVTCTVDPQPPHRIRSASTTALDPADLSPSLPADFSGSSLLAGADRQTRLIVFSGLPGTGKSTLADATGRQSGIPVFAADWPLGALTPFGGYHLDRLLAIGAEMLTTLAYRQLQLGQPAILDYPAEDLATRTRWRTLADAAGSRFKVIVCTCSDPHVHRSRLEGRQRGIPGWHQGGNWANVQRRRAEFPPWTTEVLTIDAVRPLAENLAAVLEYVAA